MRRFLGSAWFALLVSLVLAGVTLAAYAVLKPTGEDVGNSQIVQAFTYAGWAAGPVIALLSFLLIAIVNLLRRMFRLRKIALLHPVTVLVGILPWFIFAWIVTDEPPFTPFARAAIEFVARPMLWGALVAIIFTLVCSLPLLFSKKK